jgi:hypothetical protein
MSGCVLRVYADGFDAKAFVKTTGIKALRLRDASFNLNVSDCEANDLPGQIEDTLRFLESEAELLQQLRSHRANMVFDFGIAQKDVAAQFVRFPSALIGRLAEVGASLEVSLYAIEDSERKLK